MPRTGLVLCLLAASVSPLSAQNSSTSPWLRFNAQAVPVWTTVDPIPGGGSLSELRVVHPVAMLEAGVLGGRLRFMGTANLEGWTIPDGELAPGVWGEGFFDRRHPHTYVHELLVMLVDPFGDLPGGIRTSLTAGKGFAPFGTDDPMNRPPLRYPVNHHWSQILERAVVIAALGAGPLSLEAGLFNGDEPEEPDQWPRLRRWGDSWSARLLVHPAGGVELQASFARVKSPDHRPGAGGIHRKWSLSARLEREVFGAPGYALIEWARTSELDGFFVFHSALAEAQWSPGPHRIYYRFERTERPEEQRTMNLFRSLRPHLENSILGTTRWTTHTAGYSMRLDAGRQFVLGPFVEATLGRASSVGGGVIIPEGLYGRETFETVSLGVRIMFGRPMHRMGRYGILMPASAHSH
ncbi:MAG: hypothetical protein ACREL6_09350 [Gemmatimonadales bacterium]